MNYNPSSEIKQLLALLLGAVFVGWVVGTVAWTLVLTLLGYSAWNLRQQFRLYDWLGNATPKDPPVSHGFWGSIFDDIHKLQQYQLQYRVRLKKVIKRFRDSTVALNDGFVMLDQYGNIDWWNPAAERLLGLRARYDTNQLITNLVRDPRFKSYFHSGDYEQALKLRSPINIEISLEYHLTRFGKRDHLLIVRDITELKKLDSIRSDFVANVSHELRTPLTVINGYLETLADYANQAEDTDTAPAPWQKALAQMQEQTQRMNALIRDLLLLSRLESRSSSLQAAIDMSDFLTKVVTDLSYIVDGKTQRISLAITSQKRLMGSEDELYSLISNLVTNASKYSPKDSEINIVWRNVGESALLQVTDQGIGIDDHHLSRLTERFYRVDKSRSQDTGGTGLGLAIVKHILINHDAQLDVESRLGRGSIFSCRFPHSRIQPAANAAGAAAAQAQSAAI